MAYGRQGILKVRQQQGNGFTQRDFDAMEWGYQWHKRGDVDILRLEHDRDPEATDSCDFVEFSAPVNIEFEYES